MGILKKAVLLSAVVILLPAVDDDVSSGGGSEGQADVTAYQVVGAATSVAGDLSKFCSRQPAVCDTGSAVLGIFEAKAENAGRLLYKWGTETNIISTANTARASEDGLVASKKLDKLISEVAVSAPPKPQFARVKNTLRLDDVIPHWSSPGSNPSS